MRKAQDILADKRIKIVALIKYTNYSMREIERIVDVRDRSVRRIGISLRGNNEHNENHYRNCGRKHKTSVRIGRKIVNEALKNRRETSQEIQKSIARVGQAVSISTVRRRLYESGLKCRRPIKRPFL